MLTALGIIFGVAAVIAMMAIGRGAQKEILDQMKLVGVNNIVISSKTEKKKSSEKSDNSSQSETKNNSDSKETKKFSPGLTLQDAISIRQVIPTVDKVSPEVIYEVDVIRGGKKTTTKVTGITPDFFSVFNLDLIQGEMFNEEQLKEGKSVCIIGSTIKSHSSQRKIPSEGR